MRRPEVDKLNDACNEPSVKTKAGSKRRLVSGVDKIAMKPEQSELGA